MIKALHDIGKGYIKKNGSGYEYENPNPNNKYNNVIKIKLVCENNEVIYKGLEIEEFSEDKLDLYLYSKGSSRGGDNTPTTRVSKLDIPLKKLLNPIKNMNMDSFKKVHEFLSADENYDLINSDIIKNMLSKEGYILTLILDNKWIGQYGEVKDKILSENNKSFYEKYETTSKENDKNCYCCKKKKKEVYGFVNTYNFYTVDKIGFVSGGFDQKKAWKNYPICSECANILEKGKKYIEDKFTDRFSGLSYMVIPKTIFNIEDNDYFEILLEQFENKNKISLSEEKGDELLHNEKISLEAISQIENNMMFNIMFFEKDKNSFKILLNLEEILPSRLKTIFEKKKEIEKREIYLNLKAKNNYINLKFNFSIFEEFFRKDKSNNKTFLDAINSVFTDKAISYDFIIKNFCGPIIKPSEYKNSYFLARESLLILEVLNELNLLKNKTKGEVREMIERNEKNEIFLNFLESHEETFDSDLKRAIFLEGVLTQKLLNQPEQRNSGAFYSRLNSLKMSEKIVKRVFVEVINKLTEYKKKHYYFELEKIIATYLTSGNFKELSNDEMSYYFVLGMNLVDKFKTKVEEDKTQE